jgi:anti-sigma-K factor RskA
MSALGPDHAQWADSLGAYVLGALEPDEWERFEAHLAECPRCIHDVADLRVAADALPMSVPLVSPPPALKGRIMAVVNSEAELLAAAGQRADQPETQTARHDAGDRAPARDAGRAAGRRRRFSAGALGDWLLRPGVALACALLLLAGGAAAGVLLSAGEGTRTVVATTQAPGADVRLEIGEDGATLVARNMPAPPSGRIYQVWLKRPGRDPEPTSALWSTRSDGSAEVAVPGSLDGVEAVLVTDEPAGGSAAPTKPPVISAEPA